MRWLPKLRLETVIVHTKEGPSVKGILAAVHSDALVLKEAMVLEPEAQSLLNGDVVIPREQVVFMQSLGGRGDA